MKIDLDELKRKVKSGAALLDSHFGNPTWRKKCEGMDIASPEDCILGRLFGSYYNGGRVLEIRGSDYGFDFRYQMGTKENYAALQKLWEDEFANPPLGTDD